MSGSDTKYQVTLTAKDEASDPLSRIGATTEALAKKMGVLTAGEEKAAAVSPWLRMRGTIEDVHGAVGKLDSGIGSLHSRLSSLVPVFGGLGAGMGLAGIFAATEKMAEAGIAGQELSKRIGLSRQEMGKYRYLAKMTGTEWDSVTESFEKFNDTMAKSQTGKGPGAEMFKALHIGLKDAKGEARSSAAVLGDLFNAMSSQVDDKLGTAAGKRELIMKTLFSDSGGVMQNIFGIDDKDYARWTATAKRLAPPPMTDAQKKAQREYYENWQNINIVVGNVNKSISNELYPALSPVLQQMEQFLIANQATIAAFAGRNTTAFIGMMERVDWKKTGDDARYYAQEVGGVIEKLGGARTIIELLVGYKMLGWARNIISGFEAIGGAIVALDAVIGGSLFYKIFGAAGIAAWIMRPASTQTDETERKGLNENAWKGVPWLFPNAKGPDSQKLSDQFRDSDRPPSAEPNSLLNQLRRWYPDGHGGIAMPSPHSPTEALPPVLPSMPGGGISPFAFPTLDGRHPDILPLQLPAPWALGGQPAAAPPNGEVVVRFDFTGLPPGAAAYPELLPGTTGVRVDHDLPNWGLAPDNPLLGPIMPQLGRP